MSSLYQVRLGSTIRLVLVDAETEARLLGCVICGPSFVIRCGDLPSALIAGLELTDVTPSQVSILTTTPNEVTLGMKSESRTESVFVSEARVVLIERDEADPNDCLMEGHVLIQQLSGKPTNSENTDAMHFQSVYARSEPLGIFWYKSRSEFLATGKVLGGFTFNDLVVVRQFPQQFEFDNRDLNASFNSSIEFVFKKGPSIIMALSFPFPLVLWLYCVHASLKLPRISLLVSVTGNWSLSMMDGFRLSSPLLIDCFEVTAISNKLGFSLCNGAGGTILDSTIPDNGVDIVRHTHRLDERKNASGYPRMQWKSSRVWLLPDEHRVTTKSSEKVQVAEFTIEMEEGIFFSSELSGTETKLISQGQKGSTTTAASAEKPSPTSTRSTQPQQIVSIMLPVDLVKVDTTELVTCSLEDAKQITPGDLILRIDQQWVMEWDWHRVQQLLYTLRDKRPLKMLIARYNPLEGISSNPEITLRSKQVQLLLSNTQLEHQSLTNASAALSRDTGDSKLDVSASLTPSEADSREIRRRAATRQLLKRQTERLGLLRSTHSNSPGLNVPGAGSTGNTKAGLAEARIVPLGGDSADLPANDSEAKLGGLARRLLKQRAGIHLPSALAKSKSKDDAFHDGKVENGNATARNSRSPGAKVSSAHSTNLNSLSLGPALDQLLNDESISRREAAAELLLFLTNDALNKKTLGVPCISALIKGCTDDASPVIQERCAGALWNLTDESENTLTIARQGGIQALSRIILKCPNDYAKEEACGALWALAGDEANVPLIVLSGAIGPLMNTLLSTFENPGETSDFLQENASGCIWALSSNPGARKLLMEHENILTCLLQLITTGTSVTKENALGILANIFSEHHPAINQQFLHDHGARKLVQALMFGRSEPVRRNACACISALARGDRERSLEFASEGAITALLKFLLQAEENSSRISAAEGLRILAEVPENAVQLSELGSVPEVLRMLEQAKASRKERQTLPIKHSIRAQVVVDTNIHPEDIQYARKYVHFDSAVLDVGLDKMVAPPSTEMITIDSGHQIMRVGLVDVDLG